jgi:hypothetical protein
MIFKIIAFLAAAIPIFLFVRSIFFRRTTGINEGLREFKKQANLAVSIFLFLIVCVVVRGMGPTVPGEDRRAQPYLTVSPTFPT